MLKRFVDWKIKLYFHTTQHCECHNTAVLPMLQTIIRFFCILCDRGLNNIKRNGPFVNHTICCYERDSEFNEIGNKLFSLISLSQEEDFVEANKSFCLFIRGFVWRLIQSSFFFIFYLSDDDNIEKILVGVSTFSFSFKLFLVNVCFKDTTVKAT